MLEPRSWQNCNEHIFDKSNCLLPWLFLTMSYRVFEVGGELWTSRRETMLGITKRRKQCNLDLGGVQDAHHLID